VTCGSYTRTHGGADVCKRGGVVILILPAENLAHNEPVGRQNVNNGAVTRKAIAVRGLRQDLRDNFKQLVGAQVWAKKGFRSAVSATHARTQG